jgi:hypothetical protein
MCACALRLRSCVSAVHLLTSSFASVFRFAKSAKTRESKDMWDGLIAFIDTVHNDVTVTGKGGDATRDALTKLLDVMALTCTPDKVRAYALIDGVCMWSCGDSSL